VPNQNPQRVHDLLVKHVEKVAPDGVTVRVVEMHGGMPWRAKIEGPLYEAASKALEQAYGGKTVYAGEGGSIPIVSEFEKVLGAPVLLMGFGLPGENAHAPDEWMSVENYEKGMHAAAALLHELGLRRS
jgi:acetylornithine deacetylase/succinyl-diaminopimelate desuccinylase-like protein